MVYRHKEVEFTYYSTTKEHEVEYTIKYFIVSTINNYNIEEPFINIIKGTLKKINQDDNNI